MRQLFTAAMGALEREQDRWFLWAPVLLGCGIAAYFALTFEPAPLATAGALAAAAIVRWRWREGSLAAVVGGALFAAVLGFALAQGRAHMTAAPVISAERSAYVVTGWIELIEPREEGGARITIRVHEMAGLGATRQPIRIRVRTRAAVPPLKAGDAISVRAVLSPPAGPSLPGGYDFARLAWFQRLGGVGYALSAPQHAHIGVPMPWDLRLRAAFNRLRQTIATRITAVLPGERGAIAVALITGERGGISAATNAAFRDSGLVHILSISGLHMAIMAGAMFFSARFVLALFPAIALRFDIRKWAAVAGALGALGYLAISGASPPAVRSFLMVLIMFTAILLDRPALALRNVALAALAMLVVMPESLIDAGFQMSFAAVVALIAGYEAWRDRRDPTARPPETGWIWRGPLIFLSGIVASTLIASLAVAPFGIYHFHQSQQYAILANLLAVPAVNTLIMPAALATLLMLPFGLETAPLQIMGLGIWLMSAVAHWVAALPGSVIRVAAIPTASFALIIMGGTWLLLWRTAMRAWGVLAIAAGVALAPFGPRPDMLVGRSAALIAVRGEDGRLAALAGRSDRFDLGRWLEWDGDGRSPETAADPAAPGSIFTCDGSGCVARVRTRRLAVPRHPSALRDDCARADILVLRHDRPRGCAAALLIDAAALRREGTHALTFRGSRIIVSTVAEAQGRRLWTVLPGTLAVRRPRAPWRAQRPAGRRTLSDLLEVAAPENPPGAAGD
ncbi:MAG: ComEC/Rec2 family competence protein [Hyphomicrobiaceae bacterium]